MKRSLQFVKPFGTQRCTNVYRLQHCKTFHLLSPASCRLFSVRIERHSSTKDTSNESVRDRSIPNDGLTLGDFVQQQQLSNRLGSTPWAADPLLKTGPAPSFHIKTYGCQMNVNDTDIVRAILLEKGFVEASTEEEANVWLTNTCAIREKAEQKVWDRLRGLRKRKNTSLSSRTSPHGDSRVVGLLGCMAERLQDEILNQQLADVVVGPDAYRDLPNLLDDLLEPDHPATQAMNVELSLKETYEDIIPVRDSQSPVPFSAFVSIQRGCSNRCSFCIVPFTRGQERSRPLESIVAEIEQMVAEQDLKEVVLLGQNVNSYHDRSPAALEAKPLASTPGLSNDGFRNRIRRPTQGGYTFVNLVEGIADISPELRVRFTSPHPKDYPVELLHTMAERPNVCNQLHMPAQSGSTSMLKRMKRGYSREAYLELIDTVHSIIPDVALSSDFIAGFCQETEEEHQDTVSLLEQVQYEQAFLFAYSLREKTHAHRVLQDNVPQEVKQRRLQELIDVFRAKVHSKNETVEVGKLRLVLVEGPAKRQMDGLADNMTTWHGRTDQNKRIMFPVLESSEKQARVLEEGFINDQLGRTMTSSTPTESASVDFQSQVPTASLIPGEYAVVEVIEAKGHTLRGRLLWKTKLADFANLEKSKLSTMDQVQLDGFKQRIPTLEHLDTRESPSLLVSSL